MFILKARLSFYTRRDWQVSIRAAYHGDLLLQTSAEAISRLQEVEKSDLLFVRLRSNFNSSVQWVEKILIARDQLYLLLVGLLCIGGAALIVHFGDEIVLGELWAVVTLIVMAVLALYLLSAIVLQPQIKSVANFKVHNMINFGVRCSNFSLSRFLCFRSFKDWGFFSPAIC